MNQPVLGGKPDAPDLSASSRRRIYWDWINKGVSYLGSIHNPRIDLDRGCFFTPYIEGQTNYINSRWQEVVLPLAWAVSHGVEGISVKRVWQGVYFWAGLQSTSGSFPQYGRYDCDFAATAFSSYAIAAALGYLRQDCPNQTSLDHTLDCLYRSGKWLSKNNERVYSNQQVAAALALLELSLLIDEPSFACAAREKVEAICDPPQKSLFLEKKGFDLGYSTLSLEMLARYFRRTPSCGQRELIADSARRYLRSLRDLDLLRLSGAGTRRTDWIAPGGFEVFVPYLNEGWDLFGTIFSNLDVKHLPDDRHLHTDLCRLCFAFDNTEIDLTGTVRHNKRINYEITTAKEEANFRWLRPVGLHRLRGWL